MESVDKNKACLLESLSLDIIGANQCSVSLWEKRVLVADRKRDTVSNSFLISMNHCFIILKSGV